MTALVDDREPTLGVVLERLARRVSDAQAAVACASGILATAAIALFVRAPWSRFALATAAVAAFGGWIIAARSALPPRVGGAVRGLILAIGALAAFAFGLSILMKLLGTWIS